jgi:LysR family positive regulator for ilvC
MLRKTLYNKNCFANYAIMDLRALEVFATVNRSLSFTRAAQELHMSVSAVSRSVARLEEELGAMLFDRDRRGMRPTAAARELSRVATRIEAEWRGLQQSLSAGGALTGELRVFCSVTATHSLLSPLLAAYRDACPGVDVRLVTGDQADGISRVQRGEADVAVIARPGSLSGALAYLHITDSPLRVCVPRSDCPLKERIDAASGSERAALIGKLPWILPERGVSKDAIEAWLTGRFAQLPPVYARVAGHEAIVAMVSLGLGLGAAPQLVIEASGLADTLDYEDVGDGLPPLAIGLCARAGRVRDPLVAELWRVAKGQEDTAPFAMMADN